MTDLYGCSLTASIHLFVRQPIYVPNVFAPESNSGNELFALFPGPESRVRQIMQFKVFDRWGSLVHSRSGVGFEPAEHGWDGTFRGQILLPGVYVWLAEVELDTGEIRLIKGDVTLVR
ncbi:MAG TPA: hypothetical protein DCF33_07285 [Saprospirales bacterium]|nr:hypothetical protein [Saprospirales bacterium]